MKKFPVTSTKGNEYTVKIFNAPFYRRVEVYVKGRWFLRNVYRNVHLPYETDFVMMAKKAVHDYESKKVNDVIKAKQRAENIRKFEEWDGDCR